MKQAEGFTTPWFYRWLPTAVSWIYINTETHVCKLTSFENRAKHIKNINDQKIISIVKYKQWHACKFVRRCIDADMCDNFLGYFTTLDHSKHTRNNQNSIRLPAVRTEFAKKSSYFMAARIYNDLPLETRNEHNFNSFCRKPNLFLR